MAQYVFTMNRVGKIVPPKRQILKDISLSFFPGAKIGVLGLNGAGKTTNCAKLAGFMKKQNGKRPLLAACDTFRPAAIHQLEVVGEGQRRTSQI